MSSDRIGSFQSYSKISQAMQDSVEFRSLTRHEKLIWYHILCAKTVCTGIVNQGVFDVALYNGYVDVDEPDKIKEGMEFIKHIFEKLERYNWIKYDNVAKLILLPKRLKHDLPPNYNVMISRLKALRQTPKSHLREQWILHMHTYLLEAYSSNDARYRVVDILINMIEESDSESSEALVNTNDDTQSETIKETVHTEKINGLNNILEQLPKRFGDSREQRAESREQKAESREQREKTELVQKTKKSSTPTRTKKKRIIKTKTPLEDVSPRWLEMWEAMMTAKFHVPGDGLQTIWENVSDPIELCSRLSGPGYPSVEIALIHRLANWTIDNKQRSKRHLGRFLLNRFSAEQDKPKRPGQNNQTQPQSQIRHGELKADTKKTKDYKPSKEEVELGKLELKGELKPPQKKRLQEIRDGR
jgi:hypothetical protein